MEEDTEDHINEIQMEVMEDLHIAVESSDKIIKQYGIPSLSLMTQFEIQMVDKDQTLSVCQAIIDGGNLDRLYHPLRAMCYSLAANGYLKNLQVPENLMSLLTEERQAYFHTTVH